MHTNDHLGFTVLPKRPELSFEHTNRNNFPLAVLLILGIFGFLSLFTFSYATIQLVAMLHVQKLSPILFSFSLFASHFVYIVVDSCVLCALISQMSAVICASAVSFVVCRL